MPKIKKPKIGGGAAPVNMQWIPSNVVPLDMSGGGSMGPDPGGGGGGEFTNTAERDPRLDKHLDRLDRRLDDPEGETGRAIDLAGSKIRDATEGRRRVAGAYQARRGVLGSTSVQGLAEAGFLDDEGRDIAGAAAGISLQRARDNDAFALGATGAYGDAARINQGERELGLRQHLGTRGLDLQAAQFQHAQERGQLQDLLSILRDL
jgi:hypothetical protein